MTRHPPRPPPVGSAPGPDRLVGLITRARPWARGTVLVLHGDLDLDSAAVLREALDQALVMPGTVVLIDCGELAFCDSTGLSELLDAAVGAREHGSRIELVRPRPIVRRVLELTGATAVLPLRDGPLP